MHYNFFVLQQITTALQEKIVGAVVSECFTQNKNELILRFEIGRESFYIKANLQPAFTSLSFSDVYNRARKNSADLFPDCIGLVVTDVRQFKNERSFACCFNEGFTLLFKMHGQRANIILFEEEKVQTLFRTKLLADRSLSLASMDREIDWSYDSFAAHQHDLSKIYYTFGKTVWQYLVDNNFESQTLAARWQLIQQTLTLLSQNNFYIIEQNGLPVFSMLPFGKILHEYNDPLKAVSEFAYRYNTGFAFKNEKDKAITWLGQRISQGKSYIEKGHVKRQELETANQFKMWADLVMANLHAIRAGASSVSLKNFYTGEDEVIKLKPTLTPQKNAELFYKKSKNQSIELDFLGQQVAAKSSEVESLTQRYDQVERSTDLQALRSATADLQLGKKETQNDSVQLFHEFDFKGFRILVGKNAINNDLLTLKHAYKEDLWLHAKDVSGSHVVIKHQSGKKFPKDVIERAAQLAAYNSKRKTESLCPVIYTPKKFVRKRKGDPAGAVVVEKEEIIMVVPAL